MAIGDKIKKIRVKRDMTQKELGLSIGFNEKTADVRMAQYESGTRVPKEAVIVKIAEVLKVNADYLMAPAIDKTNKSFEKGGKKALEYSKQIGKVTGAFKRTVAAMKVTASYGIAATAIFAVTNAFKAGIKEIVDYDQALKNLQAITRATDAEVVGMGETIIKMRFFNHRQFEIYTYS